MRWMGEVRAYRGAVELSAVQILPFRGARAEPAAEENLLMLCGEDGAHAPMGIHTVLACLWTRGGGDPSCLARRELVATATAGRETRRG